MGWHNPEALTPNLDLLAKGGIILNNSYVQRWCAPTRAAFMSGRYAYNTGTNLDEGGAVVHAPSCSVYAVADVARGHSVDGHAAVSE